MAKLATFPSQGENAVCAYFYSQVASSQTHVAKLKTKSFRAQVFNYPVREIYSLTGFAICRQVYQTDCIAVVSFLWGSDQYVVGLFELVDYTFAMVGVIPVTDGWGLLECLSQNNQILFTTRTYQVISH